VYQTKILASALWLGSIAYGCAEDPSKAVTAAKVESAQEVAKTAKNTTKQDKPAVEAKAAKSLSLTGDILFIGSKVTGSHECKFAQWTGTVVVPASGAVEEISLSFEVDVGSLVADHKAPTRWSAKLEQHLKSDDFFSVKTHPKASFSSTKISVGGFKGKGSHTVKGELTIRGVTKQVTFGANILVTASGVTADAEFSVNRKDFGIVYPGKPDNLIRDGVVLKITLKG
jgi:polyisoprenoid-binding protein YceI